MHKQTLEVPQSISDVALQQHPSIRLLLSSAQAGWPHLILHHYHYSLEHSHACIPALLEDTLIVPLPGAFELGGTIVHSFPLRCWQSGAIFIVPQRVPTEWQWATAWDALQLYLPQRLLTEVAVVVLGVDPMAVELDARIGVYDAFIYQLSLALLAEMRAGGWAGPAYVESLIQALVLHLLRNYTFFHHTPLTRAVGLAPQALRSVLDYIHAHLDQPLTQAEVSAIAHVSPYHFARLFKQATGQSLHQYIIARRVEAAERLILAGHLTLAEIALHVGFADQSHLARHFKRHCGVTPKAVIERRTNLQRPRTNLQEVADGVG